MIMIMRIQLMTHVRFCGNATPCHNIIPFINPHCGGCSNGQLLLLLLLFVTRMLVLLEQTET